MNVNENYSEVNDLSAASTFSTNSFPAEMFVIFTDDDKDDNIYPCSLINREDEADGKTVLYIAELTDEVIKGVVDTADIDKSAIHYPTIHLFRNEEEAIEWQKNQ